MSDIADATVRRLTEYHLEYGSESTELPLGLSPPKLLRLTWRRKFAKSQDFIRTRSLDLRKEDLGLDFETRTAAHFAAGHPDGEATLQLLVETFGENCLLNADEDGVTPMHLSARFHSKAQFDRNLNLYSTRTCEILRMKDSNEFSVAHWAASNSAHGGQILLLIVEAEPQCLNWVSASDATVLEVATEALSTESLMPFISKADSKGNSVLHYAARCETAPVLFAAIEKLGSRGIRPDQCLSWKNGRAQTVLHLAARHCNTKTLQDLTESFLPKISFQSAAWFDDEGSSIFHNLAMSEIVHTRIFLSYLKTYGKLWSTHMNRLGETVLHCMARKEDLAKVFLVNEAMFGSPEYLFLENARKQTVLHIAMEFCSMATVEKLISATKQDLKALVSRRDSHGNTVLHSLARNKTGNDIYFTATNYLHLENDAGQTLLHLIAENSSSTDVLQRVTTNTSIKCDKDGNTVWHYLARNRFAESILTDAAKRGVAGFFRADTRSCTKLKNKNNTTVLHVAAEHFSAQAIKLLIENAGLGCIKLRDFNGDTVVHCLARNPTAAVEVITTHSNIGPRCLNWKNSYGWSPIDFAAKYQDTRKAALLKRMSEHFWTILDDERESIKTLKPVQPNANSNIGSKSRDANANNGEMTKARAIHSAFHYFGIDCLNWENSDGITTLQVSIRVCDAAIAKKLLKKAIDAKAACVKHKDSWGNSWAHIAANSCSDTESGAFSVVIKNPKEFELCNNDGQSVLHFAVKNPKVVKEVIEKYKKEGLDSLLTAVDAQESTLLHSLFQPDRYFQEIEAESYFKAIEALTKAEIDPLAVDKLGHNFLLAANTGVPLKAVLEKCQKNFKEMFLRLLLSSNDLHAVHIFSAKHNLRDLMERLSNLLRVPIQELLHTTVTGGLHKGATCLHFACKASHRENIKYLMEHGLRLSDETDSGWSCIGFALENDSVQQIEEKINSLGLDKLKDAELDLYRLLDPLKRALALPDKAMARQVCKDTAEKSNFTLYGTNLALLIEAFEKDSPIVLRSAFCLNKITDKEEVQLLNFLSKEKNYRGFFTESSKDQSARSELSVIDAAVSKFRDGTIKENILPDLLLTRQFELIPSCLILLIQLKPMVYKSRGKVKYERLLQLYNKVTDISVNALDGLYNNAGRREKQLLMQYMRGKCTKDQEESQGPVFPCKPAAKDGKIKCRSVMEMIEEAGNDGLFATDCVYHFARKDWHSRLRKDRTSCSGKNCSANVRFVMHLIAFIIFMVFFAWYITDFQTAFQSWPPDFVLLAYLASFTMQELAEFLRKRRKVNVYAPCGILHCPLYIKHSFNIFDCLALLFMWAGIVMKLLLWACLPDSQQKHFSFCMNSSAVFTKADLTQGRTNEPLVTPQLEYVCQKILCVSFLLWVFRSVSFMNRFQRIGPVISMLKSLFIKDLVPFVLIILVIFYSFGVFFLSLLFPVVTAQPAVTSTPEYRWSVFLQIFTLPLNLLFSNFDKTKFETVSQKDNQDLGRVAHPDGFGWFNNLLIFMFLIISNIVMLNLLIARFNLTVIKMHSRALGIWRRTYHDMLQEYKNVSFLPPPLSLLEYPARICWWRLKRNRSKAKVASKPMDCYWMESEYTKEYMDFLKFQATQLRSIRPRLSLNVTRNKSDTDILMAHAENVSTAAVRELQEALQRLETKMEISEESRVLRKKLRNQRRKQHQTRMSEILKKLEQLNNKQQQQQQQQQQQP